LDLQRLVLDTVEKEQRLHQGVGIGLKLNQFMFHFIQSIIAICLVHWAENRNSSLRSHLRKVENIP